MQQRLLSLHRHTAHKCLPFPPPVPKYWLIYASVGTCSSLSKYICCNVLFVIQVIPIVIDFCVLLQLTSLTINLHYPPTWNFCSGGRQLQVFLQHCNNYMIGSCKGNLLNVRKYRRPVSYTELWDVHLSNYQQLLPWMILMTTRAPNVFWEVP